MKTGFYQFLLVLLVFGCNTQNSVTTNKIVTTKDNLYGVKSKEGKLLIDSIYEEIRIVHDFEKLILPPIESRQGLEQQEYYLVSNSGNQKALFNKDGSLVFNFQDCSGIIVDQHTKTIVTTSERSSKKQARSYLYNMNGELLLDASYENIAFISHSDLIALIAEEGPNDEFYLYNPFEKKKLGPYDHFNVYNEDSSPPLGMEESEFEKYKRLGIINVRKEVNNDYIWGIIDAKGNEILPLEYKNLRIFTNQDKNHLAFKNAIKPEGVEFIFKGSHPSKRSTSIYIDSDFVIYEHKTISVENRAYRIEKM